MNKKTQQKLFEYITDNLEVTALYDQLIDIHKICQTTANDNLSPEITKMILECDLMCECCGLGKSCKEYYYGLR